jgi:undecaprenyl-diphosphatase
MLDVQYLRADRRFSRTRGVLFSLLGLVERSHIFRTLNAPEVSVVSHSGPMSAAHDGEVSDPVTRVRCTIDSRRLTVYRP